VTRVAGGSTSTSAVASSARVPVTTCWAPVLAEATTAAGSSAGRPAAISWAHTSPRRSAAISSTRVSAAAAVRARSAGAPPARVALMTA
jgi:hypothetical protein